VHVAAPTTGPDVGVTTLTKTRRTPTPITLACPRGDVFLDAEALAAVPVADAAIAASLHGARVRTALGPRHRLVSLQVTCRAQNAPVVNQGRLGLGTAGADHITTSARCARWPSAAPATTRSSSGLAPQFPVVRQLSKIGARSSIGSRARPRVTRQLHRVGLRRPRQHLPLGRLRGRKPRAGARVNWVVTP
jgi:hypothetical protein